MHGITVMEAATNVVATKQVDSAIPCVIGTAPINMGSERDIGKPVIAYSFEEAAEKLGYSDNWTVYTLCEAMHVLFRVLNVSPVVFINVLDTNTHTEEKAYLNLNVAEDGSSATVEEEGVLLDSLKIGELKLGEDYSAAFDKNGHIVVKPLKEGVDFLAASGKKLAPSKVSTTDIIGGYDTDTGKSTGIELVDDVYHVCGVIPATLIAPGYSDKDAVADVLIAKARQFDTVFSAIAACDIATNEKKYAAVAEAAKDRADTYAVQCWPCAPMDATRVVHRSVIFAGMCASTDADYGNIPYASPSNRPLAIDGLCTENGEKITLNYKQANAVENAGVYTGVRLDTWKAWGTYTSAVNASGDPKDIFIAVRRMMNWHKNTFVVNYFSKVDNPADTRLVENLIDNENKRIDGLKSIGAVAGGRMLFLDADNPIGNILAGKLRFRQKLGFWVPAREIENVIEIDTELLKAALGGE